MFPPEPSMFCNSASNVFSFINLIPREDCIAEFGSSLKSLKKSFLSVLLDSPKSRDFLLMGADCGFFIGGS